MQVSEIRWWQRWESSPSRGATGCSSTRASLTASPSWRPPGMVALLLSRTRYFPPCLISVCPCNCSELQEKTADVFSTCRRRTWMGLCIKKILTFQFHAVLGCAGNCKVCWWLVLWSSWGEGHRLPLPLWQNMPQHHMTSCTDVYSSRPNGVTHIFASKSSQVLHSS